MAGDASPMPSDLVVQLPRSQLMPQHYSARAEQDTLVVHHAFVQHDALGPDETESQAVTELLTIGRGDEGQLMCDDAMRPQPKVVEGFTERTAGNMVQIAASTFHTAVVTTGGELWVAGANDDGQATADTTDVRITKPRRVGALESQQIVAASAGYAHTAACNAEGGVITWGNNEDGQLGHAMEDDSSVYRRPPRLMRGLRGVRAVQVACGENFTVVLSASGSVYTTGNGSQGCLGLGDRTSQNEATVVPGLAGVPCVQVSAGSMHVVATTVSGIVYAWGRNKSGRLGLPLDDVPHAATTPQRVTALPELIQQTACGDDHTMFVTRSGRVFAAGCGVRGQLGLPVSGLSDDAASSVPTSPSTSRAAHPLLAVDTPAHVMALEGFPVRQVACGTSFTMFLLQSGSVLACGANDAGQTALLHPPEGSKESEWPALAAAHPASAASLGVAPPFRPSDIPLPTRVPALCDRGVFTLGAGAEHVAAIRVIRGSVLSTPPGSMPRGSMAFVDAASLTAAARFAAITSSQQPLRRIISDVFGDATALNGSFLRSSPQDFKLIEVRAPGAQSLVSRLSHLPARRLPHLLEGAEAALRASSAAIASSSFASDADLTGGASRLLAATASAKVQEASDDDDDDDNDEQQQNQQASKSAGQALLGASATPTSYPKGLVRLASAEQSYSLRDDDVDDEPPSPLRGASPGRASTAAFGAVADGISAAGVVHHHMQLGDAPESVAVSGRGSALDVAPLRDAQQHPEASLSLSVDSTSNAAFASSSSSSSSARVGDGTDGTAPMSLMPASVTRRTSVLSTDESLASTTPAIPSFPLQPPSNGAHSTQHHDQATSALVRHDHSGSEVAIAMAGGPFPSPRVVVMYPEFRVIGAGTPYPARADVAKRLESSGIDVFGLEIAYRALFAGHMAEQPGEAEVQDPLADIASAAGAASSSAASASTTTGADTAGRQGSASSSAGGVGSSSSSSSKGEAGGIDSFVLKTTFESVTSLLVDVRRRAKTLVQPDSLRFIVILLLCPLISHVNRFSAEIVARLCEVIVALPAPSRHLLTAWLVKDVPPPLFAARILKTLHAHLNAFVKGASTGRSGVVVFPGVTVGGAMHLLLEVLDTLRTANDRTAETNRAAAISGLSGNASASALAAAAAESSSLQPAAPAGAALGPHLASTSGPSASNGVYGMGLLDGLSRVEAAASAALQQPLPAVHRASSVDKGDRTAAAQVAQAIRSSSIGDSASAAGAASGSAAGVASAAAAGAAVSGSDFGVAGVHLVPGVTFMSRQGDESDEWSRDEDAASAFATAAHAPASPVTGAESAAAASGSTPASPMFSFEGEGDAVLGRMHAGVSAWLGSTPDAFALKAGAAHNDEDGGSPLSAEELESKAWGLVHFSSFYSASLSDMPDSVLFTHYDQWRAAGFGRVQRALNLCNYHHLLSASAKRRILGREAALQQTQQAHNAMARAMLFGGGSPYLVLEVRRANLLGDALTRLSQEHPQSLKRPLKVVFIGEEGVDAGGVTREFFQLAITELFDERFAMFQRLDSGAYMLSRLSLETETEFRLAGLLCGLAIYNNVVLDLQFPTAIYKKLLSLPTDLFDLTEVNPGLGRGLQQLLAYDGDDVEDIFCLDFTVSEEFFGSSRIIPLVEGGVDKPVTSANKEEYVRSMVDYHLNRAVGPQFRAFARGFLSVADGPALHLFRPEELSLLVSGQGYLDFDALRSATVYDGGFTAEHPCIRRFWRVVRGMTDEQRRKLLLFATGASRAPIGGLAKLDPPFKLQRNGPDTKRLPTAATCFHTILLPEYSTEEGMRTATLRAIEECQGFGLQ